MTSDSALFCCDIGGSSIKLGLALFAGDFTPLPPRPINAADPDALIAQLVAAQEHYLPQAKALAISITGVLDPDSQRLTCANIPCLHGQNFAALLKRHTDLPFKLFNDAACFTLAEASSGAAQGHDMVLGIILGSGVGGALVHKGQIISGEKAVIGEWGHGTILSETITSAGPIPLAIPHVQCGCGSWGCVNTIGGARGLERLHALLHGGADNSRTILASWTAGNPTAEKTMAAYFELLSQPLAYTLNITGAGAVPVGGGLSHVPELIARLDEEVRAKILWRTTSPLLVPSHYDDQAGLRGAAIATFQALKQGQHGQ